MGYFSHKHMAAVYLSAATLFGGLTVSTQREAYDTYDHLQLEKSQESDDGRQEALEKIYGELIISSLLFGIIAGTCAAVGVRSSVRAGLEDHVRTSDSSIPSS